MQLQECRSVEQFATALYTAQFREPAQQVKRRYTWDECYRFHYALFCVAPLWGLAMERMALREIREALVKLNTSPDNNNSNSATHELAVREATEHEDVECAVDLVVERTVVRASKAHASIDSPVIVLGIQVKPESVLHRKNVMAQNKRKQETFGAPVTFMVYDREGVFRPTAGEVVKRWVKESLP